MEPVARISPALAQRARDTHELWSIRRVEPSSASVSPRAGAVGIAVGLVGVASCVARQLRASAPWPSLGRRWSCAAGEHWRPWPRYQAPQRKSLPSALGASECVPEDAPLDRRLRPLPGTPGRSGWGGSGRNGGVRFYPRGCDDRGVVAARGVTRRSGSPASPSTAAPPELSGPSCCALTAGSGTGRGSTMVRAGRRLRRSAGPGVPAARLEQTREVREFHARAARALLSFSVRASSWSTGRRPTW